MKCLLSIASCIALLTDWVSPAQLERDAGAGAASHSALEGPDCNSNGVEDAVDIASGYSIDLDGNGVPDECDARRL